MQSFVDKKTFFFLTKNYRAMDLVIALCIVYMSGVVDLLFGS